MQIHAGAIVRSDVVPRRGFESGEFSQWATAPRRFWAVGLPLVGTLFDGGLRKQRLNGGGGYLEVVTSQSAALTNERTAIDIAQRRLDASELLVKALGDLWDPT